MEEWSIVFGRSVKGAFSTDGVRTFVLLGPISSFHSTLRYTYTYAYSAGITFPGSARKSERKIGENMGGIGERERTVRSPPLTSLFACNKHPNFQDCVRYADASYARDLEAVAIGEKSTPHSRLAQLGSCTAVLYPHGDADRLPAAIDGYMAFLFLDDLIDDSTDLGYVSEITRQFLRVANGAVTDDARFLLLSRFFRDARWDARVLALAQAEAARFMDGALAGGASVGQVRRHRVGPLQAQRRARGGV